MPTSKQKGILPWLRLLRIPNLPSAISNILMAFLLVSQAWTPTIPLLLLIVASSAMYLAGMVLNDAFDYEVDLAQRPNRPLPSGQISIRAAWIVGFGLLISGVVIACVAGWIGSGGAHDGIASPVWRTAIIAVALAICIVLYDGPLKRTIAAPFVMGGCRTLNILLGASTFLPSATGGMGVPQTNGPFADNLLFGMPLIIWWVAIAIGGLITGATLLGRKEAEETQRRGPLLFAGLIMLVSLIALALTVYCPTESTQFSFKVSETQKTIFPLFIGFMSLTIIRRAAEAIVTAKPKAIQIGVVSVLRSLIIIDAAVCYLAAPHQIAYALVVLTLLIPTLFLGRFIAST